MLKPLVILNYVGTNVGTATSFWKQNTVVSSGTVSPQIWNSWWCADKRRNKQNKKHQQQKEPLQCKINYGISFMFLVAFFSLHVFFFHSQFVNCNTSKLWQITMMSLDFFRF